MTKDFQLLDRQRIAVKHFRFVRLSYHASKFLPKTLISANNNTIAVIIKLSQLRLALKVKSVHITDKLLYTYLLSAFYEQLKLMYAPSKNVSL